MPRVKQPDSKVKDDLVRGYLAKGQAIQGLSDEQVAIRLHCNRTTYQRKKKRPATFSLGEIRKLGEILKLAPEEITQFM